MSRTTRRAARAVSAAGLAAAALLAPVSAAVAAAVVEGPAVEEAVRTSPLTAGVDPAAYVVADVRLAAADPAWAAARIAPVPGAALDPADVVLRDVAGRWEVVELGTAEVGCGTAPAPVLADFGTVCAG